MSVARGSGSYVHFSPRPCPSTDRWARLSTHRHHGSTLCARSEPSYSLWPLNHRMCVVAWRRGAVSNGSHMQQYVDTSKAPPHLGAPFSLVENVDVSNSIGKIDKSLPSDRVVLGACCNVCFRLRWAPNRNQIKIRHGTCFPCNR